MAEPLARTAGTPVARTTACTLDCPDSCSLSVHRDANGRLVVEAAAHDGLTDGFICSKVRRIERHLSSPERLSRPLRRVGPKGSDDPAGFEEIGWDEALDLIAERMRSASERSGGEAILPLSYGGSNGLLTQDTTDALLFSRLGASRLQRTVCAAPSTAATSGLYGKMAGVALEDYVHSELIVVWGANPSATGIHLVPKIRRAQENGARLVVVDPRRIPLAKQADLVLQPLPGTDLALALCVIRELWRRGHADESFLERYTSGAEELRQRADEWTLDRAAATCGVAANSIDRLVELYAASSPAVIRCGWGPERNRNGASAIAAIVALPAVAGKFGVRGGGYTMSNTGVWRDAGLRDFTAGWNARQINQNHVGRALLELDDPPIEVLFVYNHNPLMTLPEQERVRRGLLREDLFTVVFDPVMTDTARYADLVLPATTFLEHEDVARGYGQMVIHRTRPVIPVHGESRSNVDLFAELVRRLGLERPGDPLDETSARRALLGETDRSEGPEGLAQRFERRDRIEPSVGTTPIQFVDAFPLTSSGRVELCAEALDRAHPRGLYRFLENPAATEEHPLTLISPASRHRISSTFGQLDRSLARIGLHPDDAAARGLDGRPDERVRVFNRLGEVICGVRIDADLRPGVAELQKGLWSHHTANGRTSNALVPDHLSDVAGGACFNDARVEVEAV
ncbi:MAG: molybdopterin oxidoreductase family protein [Acidobacteria bacterium]|nr:MAG: molybdopterin oxidoreductase family protein [Acidobacteriota bacterium]REK07285.1 MAG: molybdopterin oxidoreductase family protein [Acidobacteriota bacterium]